MKKICHVADELSVGGIERTVLSIALNLKGYEHQIWCLKSKGVLAADAGRAGVVVREFGFFGSIGFAKLISLAGEMKKERFDIVHGHGLYPSIWARTAAVIAGVPVRIAHAQSLYYGLPWRDRAKLRLLARATSKIAAVSEAVKTSLVEGVGIAEPKIEVIYNSSPDMRLQSVLSRHAIRESFGCGSSFVIGGVGRLEPLKGFGFLVEAVGICRQRGVNVKCIIVGEGPERARLEKMIGDMGLRDVVILSGLRNDIGVVLSAMDAMVQASIEREGLPLTLAEASSTGLPLIATAVGGNPEIAINGDNGFVVPPHDAAAIAEKICALAGDPDMAKKMGERSRALWQEKFTLERMMTRIDDLYGRCSRGKGG